MLRTQPQLLLDLSEPKRRPAQAVSTVSSEAGQRRTRLIPLTQGKFAIVDEEDFERVMRYKWQANTSGDGKFYAQRVIRAVNAKSVIQQMPQFILNTQRMVDHRDGNGLNNTGLNIRVCTPMQNARNRPVASRNKAGFKGVHPTKGTRSNWSAVEKENS